MMNDTHVSHLLGIQIKVHTVFIIILNAKMLWDIFRSQMYIWCLLKPLDNIYDTFCTITMPIYITVRKPHILWGQLVSSFT